MSAPTPHNREAVVRSGFSHSPQLTAYRLQPHSVRVWEGKRLVTDGPFAETREQLGGYFLIDAADLDEAEVL